MGNLENDRQNLKRWSDIIEGKYDPCHELTEEERDETSEVSQENDTMPNTGPDDLPDVSDVKPVTPFDKWLPMFREYCNRER